MGSALSCFSSPLQKAATYTFEKFDINGNGALDRNELLPALKTFAQYINKPITQDQCKDLMDEHDADNSGDLDMDEFMALVLQWANSEGISDSDVNDHEVEQHNEPGGVISPGGQDAGDQGQTSNCGLYSTINSLEDQLRTQHDIQLDAKAAVQTLDQQNYEWNGKPVRKAGTNMRSLIDNINNSFQNGMTLPCADGSTVTMTLNLESREGDSGAECGDIVLTPLNDGRGNHFMEVESVDDGVIHTQNSWAGQMKAEVPGDTFGDALYNYTVTLDDVQQN